MNISKIVLLSLSAALVGTTTAQTRLTLEECRTMALENNHDMKAAQISAEKAGYDLRAMRANFLPKISGYGYYLYTDDVFSYQFAGTYLPIYTMGSEGLVPDLALNPSTGQPVIGADGNPVFNQYAAIPPMRFKLKTSGTYSAGLKLEQPIYLGGKIRSAYKMARIGTELASLNKEQSRAATILQVDEAYWQYVKTLELVKSASSYLETVQALEKRVSDGVATGMSLRNDQLKVQVKVNEANLLLSKARNGQMLAQMNLCHIVGLPLATDIQIVGAEEGAPMVLHGEGDIADRPEYKMLEQEVELRSREVALARSEFLPQVGVAAGYGYSHGLNLNGSPLLSDDTFVAVASVSIPLFHWGEGRNKVRAARAEEQLSREKQAKMEELMHLEEAQYRFSMNDAALQVTLTEQSLAQAEENLRMSRDLYETGKETLVNYLEAQTQWQKASSDLIEAQAELRISQSRYLKAIGKL